jgi:hypothetical protein
MLYVRAASVIIRTVGTMQRKEITLIGVLLVLGVIYAIFFTDIFARRRMFITASVRPTPGLAVGTPIPVFFKLNRAFELTTLKVVPLNGTNYDEKATPIWYLVAQTNSHSVRFLEYGIPVRGMHPAVPRSRPEPLEPGKIYRMLLTGGGYSGYTDFKTIAQPAHR